MLQGNPRFIDIYIGLAECCLGRGEPAHALEYYDKALSVNPDFLQAYLNKAAVSEMLGRSDKALASLEAVLRIVPGHAEALFQPWLDPQAFGPV